MMETYNNIWSRTQKKYKNLLFDLIASQPQNPIEKKHGGSEYTKVVFKHLIKSAVNKNIKIDAVYNSNVELDKDIKNQSKKYSINLISIKNKNEIENVLNRKSYDRFFSGLGYGLRSVRIPSNIQFIPVVHGLRPVEMPKDKYEKYYFISQKQRFITFIKNLFYHQYFEYRKKDYYKFLKNNKDNLIVVSNHTKNSIINYYPDLKTNNIKVLYSPEKSSNKTKIKKNNSKYILMVSASVWIKNSYRGILALDKFFQQNKFRHFKAIILGGLPDKIFNQIKNKQNFEIHNYVTTEKLEEYYANAHLFFYPTLNEGFGYPPLEAMKYGTPVIASSNSAVPEICEDSILYFDPYSIKQMTNKLIQFQSLNYKIQQQKSVKQYLKIKKKQDKDLKEMVKLILN